MKLHGGSWIDDFTYNEIQKLKECCNAWECKMIKECKDHETTLDKLSSKDRALNRLIVAIHKLRDKVQRRNMQIKDLKETLSELKTAMTNDQYLTVREILNV